MTNRDEIGRDSSGGDLTGRALSGLVWAAIVWFEIWGTIGLLAVFVVGQLLPCWQSTCDARWPREWLVAWLSLHVAVGLISAGLKSRRPDRPPPVRPADAADPVDTLGFGVLGLAVLAPIPVALAMGGEPLLAFAILWTAWPGCALLVAARRSLRSWRR